MSYSAAPQLGVERLVFLDNARAVADWDAQFDPIVPLERRDRQEVDAVRHEPAGVLRELQRRQERRDVLRAGSRSRGARGGGDASRSVLWRRDSTATAGAPSDGDPVGATSAMDPRGSGAQRIKAVAVGPYYL